MAFLRGTIGTLLGVILLISFVRRLQISLEGADLKREVTSPMILPVNSGDNTSRNRHSSESFVHIVSTRFMQHQPHLAKLGKARLILFKTFCLPTMVQQTSKRFLWIIRTDPELDDELLHDMSQLLQPYPHFFLIRSNDNGSKVANLELESVVTGDVNLLKQVVRHMDTSIRIETRLDADDGLKLDFVQYLQNQVIPTKQTLVFCVGPHLEWISHSNQLKPTRVNHCITPGLTVMTSPNGKVLPKIPHHKIASLVPPCNHDAHNKREVPPHCLMRLDLMKRPAAIRARTPTSAGMANVLSRDDSNAAHMLWQFLVSDFGLNLSAVEEARQYLQTQQQEIAVENLKGQWYVNGV